ncbi:hypothetical protein B0H13DRAFT_1865247 [Mycena leptocephala]|nr:hypothetical protein B0H13DRAFT_1865247 [Mycena leptocephala]
MDRNLGKKVPEKPIFLIWTSREAPVLQLGPGLGTPRERGASKKSGARIGTAQRESATRQAKEQSAKRDLAEKKAADIDGRRKSEDSTHQRLPSQKCGVEGREWWRVCTVQANERSKTGIRREGRGKERKTEEGGMEGEKEGGGSGEGGREERGSGKRVRTSGRAYQAQVREQNNDVREQCDIAGAFQLGAHHRCGEAIRGGGGAGEEEERDEGAANSLKRGRGVRAQEHEENMRRESEEQAEEEHAQGRGGSTARCSRPPPLTSRTWAADESRCRAGGRQGEGSSWHCCLCRREGTARPRGVRRQKNLVFGVERAVDIIVRTVKEWQDGR